MKVAPHLIRLSKKGEFGHGWVHRGDARRRQRRWLGRGEVSTSQGTPEVASEPPDTGRTPRTQHPSRPRGPLSYPQRPHGLGTICARSWSRPVCGPVLQEPRKLTRCPEQNRKCRRAEVRRAWEGRLPWLGGRVKVSFISEEWEEGQGGRLGRQ